MKLFRYLHAILFILTSFVLSATSESISIGGIPSSKMGGGGIRRIFKDSEGYLWYGNTNGLCRDDGYNIKIFHTGQGEYINNITEDKQGRILVSTERGAYIVDKRNYNILPLDEKRLGAAPVNSIYVTSDSDLWVNHHGLLSRYSSDLKLKTTHSIHDRSGKPSYVSGLAESPNGDIYMTSYSRGVYRLDKKTGKFIMAFPISDNVSLGQILKDRKRNYYWIHDYQGHLYRFTPDSSEHFVRSNVRPPESSETYYENLIDICQDDSSGYLWGVTRKHLLAFRPEKDGQLTPLAHPYAKTYDGSIMTSLFAAPGALHIGSLDRGSSVIYFNDNRVKGFQLPNIKVRDGTYPMISAAIPANRNGLWWINQLRYGLMLYDINTDECSVHNDFPEIANKRMRMAEVLSTSKRYRGVWVSQERSQGIYAMTNKDMKILCVDSVSFDHLVNPTVTVTALLEDSGNNLWIGTSDGLLSYSFDDRDFTFNYPEAAIVSNIVETADGRIFALSKSKGFLEIINGKVNQLTDNENPISYGTALAVAPDDNIWIGTGKGEIIEYNVDKKSFTDRTSLNPLLRNGAIRKIEFTNKGHAWIVTDSRVFEVSLKTGNTYVHECDKDLPLSRILCVSPTNEENGTLILGGVGGMAEITPNPTLDTNESAAHAVITDVVVGEESRIADMYTDDKGTLTIKLLPDDHNIAFLFSTLNHREAGKVRFAYRIADINSAWQYTEPGANRAFFNSLSRGKHILEVKVIDEFGRESSEITKFTVIKKPHWYESWWAICLYTLILLSIIAGALYYYSRKIKNENETMWADSKEMIKMRTYLESPVTLPDEEYKKLDRILLQKATQTVEANLDDPDFDVNALCSAVNMSRSTFARKLKSTTGMTPLDFIRDVKMKHACNLLKSNNYTISQISDMLGFNDRRYFTATFRKVMGMAPREWQEKNRAEKEG